MEEPRGNLLSYSDGESHAAPAAGSLSLLAERVVSGFLRPAGTVVKVRGFDPAGPFDTCTFPSMGHVWGINLGEPTRMGAEACGSRCTEGARLRLSRAENAGRCGRARMPEEGLEPPTRGL
jgi:hypothetical protein